MEFVAITSSIAGLIVSYMYIRIKRVFKKEILRKELEIQTLRIYLDFLDNKFKKEESNDL